MCTGPGGSVKAQTAPCGSILQRKHIAQAPVMRPALECPSFCRQLQDTSGLVRQVDVHGVDGELKKVAEQALSLKPNFAYTLKEIRGEMEQIFDTGFFSLAAPKAEDTRDGVKITVEVRSNNSAVYRPPPPPAAGAGTTRPLSPRHPWCLAGGIAAAHSPYVCDVNGGS